MRVRAGAASSVEQERAAAEVIRACYPRLLVVARRLTGSASEAEDLVQEAFVETLSRYPYLDGLRAPFGYLMTVLYRSAFRRRRLPVREVPLDLQDRLEAESPDRDAPMFAEQALAMLGRKQRACLELRYLYDLDVDEIALALACTASTVRSQIARALAHLREGVSDGRP